MGPLYSQQSIVSIKSLLFLLEVYLTSLVDFETDSLYRWFLLNWACKQLKLVGKLIACTNQMTMNKSHLELNYIKLKCCSYVKSSLSTHCTWELFRSLQFGKILPSNFFSFGWLECGPKQPAQPCFRKSVILLCFIGSIKLSDVSNLKPCYCCSGDRATTQAFTADFRNIHSRKY